MPWQVCPASSLGWPNASYEKFAQFDPCGHDNQMDIQVMFKFKPKSTGFRSNRDRSMIWDFCSLDHESSQTGREERRKQMLKISQVSKSFTG